MHIEKLATINQDITLAANKGRTTHPTSLLRAGGDLWDTELQKQLEAQGRAGGLDESGRRHQTCAPWTGCPGSLVIIYLALQKLYCEVGRGPGIVKKE